MVEIYRDRVEIIDPGELPPGMKRSDLGHKSVHRNPRLADLFHRMGEIEKIGSGIHRMRNAAKKAHVAPPRFEVSGFFVITFKRTDVGVPLTENMGQVPDKYRTRPKGRRQYWTSAVNLANCLIFSHILASNIEKPFLIIIYGRYWQRGCFRLRFPINRKAVDSVM